MPPRNHSVLHHLQRRAADHEPAFHYTPGRFPSVDAWRDALTPRLIDTLGTRPTKVPLNPEVVVEWEEHGLIKQKIVFDVEAGLSVSAYVFRPAQHTEPLPAILCCHGHGPLGKNAVMGCPGDDAGKAIIAQGRLDYGLKMAQAGFVTMAIDWRGFGERDDRAKPHWRGGMIGQRDPCNVHYLLTTLLGTTPLAGNLHDASCCLDYLAAQPFVDARRIGVMGESFGGTMALWTALCEPQRVKAVDVLCYADRFVNFGYRDANLCGSQITPGLFSLCDVSDLHGLVAPRPLLVEIGLHDTCFDIESAMACYHETARIYENANVSDRLELDLFPGGHGWGGNKSRAFFTRHLG